MRKNTLEQALRESVTVVSTKPYSQQSPEEKAMLAARISTLITTRAVSHMFMDNLPHIAAAIPEGKTPEMKMIRQRLTKLVKEIKNLIPLANEAVRVSDLILTASKVPNPNIEDAGYLCADIIRNVYAISLDKFILIRNALNMISEGSLKQEDLDKIGGKNV